jgi:hypothetical protein
VIATADLRPPAHTLDEPVRLEGTPGSASSHPARDGGAVAGGDAAAGGDAVLAARAPLRAFGTRRDILVWTMRLNASECTSTAAAPCYNIYAINSTSGELLWYAYRCV